MSDKTNRQIAEMQKLTQKSAAWAVDLSPRALRDAVGLERAADGSYDLRHLVAWARGRMPTEAHLSDAESEKLLVISEQLSLADSQQPAALSIVGDLCNKYGSQVYATLVELLVEKWRAGRKLEDELASDPGAAARQAEYQRRIEQEALARDRLQIVVRCEHCQRVRYGRRWIKRQVPSGHVIIGGCCPKCDRSK